MANNILTPEEILVIGMALETIIEDIEASSKDQRLNFNPEGRQAMKEMLQNAKSAKSKLESTTGYEVKLDPYQEGDENEFLTKES